MSVESISEVLNADLDVTPTAKLVLIGIANHDGDGGSWPSIKTLSRYAGVSERSVQYALANLEGKGLIVRHLNQGGTARTKDRNRPNLYELTLSTGVKPVAPGGVKPASPGGVKPVAPEPSSEPSVEPSVTPLPPAVDGRLDVLEPWEVMFIQFWESYPRKIAKPAARRSFKAKVAVMDDTAVQCMIDGTNAWMAHWIVADTEEQFIPHPATFLNQERYNDHPPRTALPSKQSAVDIINRIAQRDQ